LFFVHYYTAIISIDYLNQLVVINEQTLINDGLVYANGDTLPIGIMEQEVLKVYRGKISKGDKVLVCTWFDHADFPFGPSIGTEGVIFGVKVLIVS